LFYRLLTLQAGGGKRGRDVGGQGKNLPFKPEVLEATANKQIDNANNLLITYLDR
jgi:hypothetical protein